MVARSNDIRGGPVTALADQPAARYAELARQLTGIGAVKRDLARLLPPDCPPGSAAVLTVLDRHGEMRLSRLSEYLAIDISVTSRHVAHTADRGWITRDTDPGDARCRILRPTPAGLALLTELGTRHTGALETALADWSDEDVDHLNVLLARLRSSFTLPDS
ncbi:MarR family winged helix-turn-helix transcriptional regulator [Streptomyces sp. 5.8]|uniref:MarR family winged helix-turn-helix transcriptional regulator n=1 Tax=Streptomyces sp. 5.8 TaxID=3406571 RepID=UPI003BB7497D